MRVKSPGNKKNLVARMPLAGVLVPLRRLQGEQAATTFSQVVWPPRERGHALSLAGVRHLRGTATAGISRREIIENRVTLFSSSCRDQVSDIDVIIFDN
jgi:hypothetical protein